MFRKKRKSKFTDKELYSIYNFVLKRLIEQSFDITSYDMNGLCAHLMTHPKVTEIDVIAMNINFPQIWKERPYHNHNGERLRLYGCTNPLTAFWWNRYDAKIRIKVVSKAIEAVKPITVMEDS